MEQYFFIFKATADSRDVIEVVEGLESEQNLTVTEWDRRDRQLWCWTTNGLLKNKLLGLVIEVSADSIPAELYGMVKKKLPQEALDFCKVKKVERKDVVVSKENGQLNQKWIIADGMIRSCSDEHSNLTQCESGVLGAWSTDKYTQKWRLVPQAMSDAYEIYLGNGNPVVKAIFHKTVLLEHMKCVLGCTIEEYERNLQTCVPLAYECADKLDKVTKGAGVIKTGGGSVCIVGNVMALAGLQLAPITGTLSLGLTVIGGITSAAGGLVTLKADVDETKRSDNAVKKVQPLLETTIRQSNGLHDLLLQVCKDIENANNFISSPNGKTFLEEGIFGLNGIRKIVVGIKNIYASGNKVVAETAEIAAAGGIKLPISGKVLLKAGSSGAKAFSRFILLNGMLFAIKDVVDGRKQTLEGSAVASEIRELTQQILEGIDLIKTYKELLEVT